MPKNVGKTHGERAIIASGKEEGNNKEVKRSRGWETPGRDGRTDAIADDDDGDNAGSDRDDDDHTDDDDTEDDNDVER